MKRASGRVGWAVLAAAVLCAAGCRMPPSKMGFNDILAAHTRRLAKAAFAFQKALAPLKTGQSADVTAARTAYTDMEKGLKEIKADVAWQPSPPGSKAGADLLNDFKIYLDVEQKILDEDMKPMLDKVEDPKVSNDDKLQYINDKFKDVAKKDDEAYNSLALSQGAYCKEQNYAATTQAQLNADAKKK